MKLRVYDADPDRVERIRARCLSALRASRREREAQGSRLPGWRTWLEPALAVGVGALYLAEVVSLAQAVTRALAVDR